MIVGNYCSTFIYNKTIGPLKLNDKKTLKSTSKRMKNIKLSCLLIKRILEIIFINYKIHSKTNLSLKNSNTKNSKTKTKSKNNLEYILNNIANKLYNNIYNL